MVGVVVRVLVVAGLYAGKKLGEPIFSGFIFPRDEGREIVEVVEPRFSRLDAILGLRLHG